MNFNLRVNKLINPIILLIIFLITSCTAPKDIVYFQDELIGKDDRQTVQTELTYKPNDLLTIVVSGLDPEAVKPFNLPVIANNSSLIRAQGELKMQTYLVDLKGNIEFPVLGTINIGGHTTSEATEMLKIKLIEYIKDPIVNIRLANFTISVLGEVNKPGTFTIEDEKISLIEALGLAGDLTIYGKRENVLLIREDNGVKRITKFDLTSIKVVNSPQYYLTQNDMIYVEPNKSRVRSSSYNQNNVIIISAVATLAAILSLVIK
jgi:polysaccharide export outer membrane protein